MVTTRPREDDTTVDADDNGRGAPLRTELLRVDARMETQLQRSYASALTAIEKEAAALLAERDRALARGETIDKDWINRAQRLTSLEQRVRAEMGKFAVDGYDLTLDGQRDVIRLTANALDEMIVDHEGPRSIPIVSARSGMSVGFSGLNVPAVENLVGQLSNGERLTADHFDMSDDMWDNVRDVLTDGMITGRNSDVIARDISNVSTLPYWRAVALSRTETFNAQRDASLLGYNLNSDIIQGWIWHADRGVRTCAVCWAMHGTLHKLNEPMRSHVSCRCVPMPYFKDERPRDIEREYGRADDYFRASLSERDQQRVLRGDKFFMWQEGKITLADLVGTQHSKVWGKSLYEKTYTDLLSEGFEPSSKAHVRIAGTPRKKLRG